MHSLNITIEDLQTTLNKFEEDYEEERYNIIMINEGMKEMRFSSHLLSKLINNLKDEKKTY
tara:strand:- start:3067 stop:3249 length:183 start_codon:yes stop_codon:yes gene_type:complete